MPRIVFMGTPEFAVPTLEALVEEYGSINDGVVAVVTVPDRKKGRGQQLSYSPVKEIALKLGFEEDKTLLQPESLSDEEFIKSLEGLDADIFCVLAFRILPECVFTIPTVASFNIHGSLLPKYRGAAPINRAIMNGETKTGLTTFILQKKVDTGNIIETQEIDVPNDMTAGELHDKMMPMAAEIAISTTNKLISSDYRPMKQDDRQASPAPKIFRENCKIDFNNNANDIHNHIRGLSPYPGAWTNFNGKVMKIIRSEVIESEYDLKPGEYRIHETTFEVGTENQNLNIRILTLQLEGKKLTNVESFLAGYRGEKEGSLI